MGKNKEKFKVEEGRYNMCTAFREMIEEGRVLGFGQGMEQGMEQGIEQGMEQGIDYGKLSKIVELVCKKLIKGRTLIEIAADLEEEIEFVKPIYDIAQEYAPDYKVENICKKYKEIYELH